MSLPGKTLTKWGVTADNNVGDKNVEKDNGAEVGFTLKNTKNGHSTGYEWGSTLRKAR